MSNISYLFYIIILIINLITAQLSDIPVFNIQVTRWKKQALPLDAVFPGKNFLRMFLTFFVKLNLLIS